MDKLTPEQRSKNMRAIKNKGSQIERLLMKALWHKGYRYRKHVKTVYGHPDIVFGKYKIAIFCDSEFWHGKDWNHQKSGVKSNPDFWHSKIQSNIERDRKVNDVLKGNGWTVLRFWGKDIVRHLDLCVQTIEIEFLRQSRESTCH